MLPAEELSYHIRECALYKRESQKKIYSSFYGYAMSICDRYTNNYEDAVETVNDGFLKIFREIVHYKPAYNNVVSSFTGWLRKIMINTAIDHFRKNQKFRFVVELDDNMVNFSSGFEDVIDKISTGEIIKAIKLLSPACRTVFNLYVIEGFTHDEIANKLGISSGTSKSNLFKAKKQLQKLLVQENQIFLKRNVV
ncbi:MAG TPA: sigma-70 family RNA polymerase sigma factor [Chitinophagaceae bacterium]|nr:sigma-70 family RNA polymerase sigma factor [Chitinophagaceae bacterium]